MASAAGTAAFVRLALLVYVGTQGAPPSPPSPVVPPRVSTEAPAPLAPEMRPLLARACYPCHSDERADPWYAKLAPSSWSTRGARDALNFSLWATYDDDRRARAAGAIAAVTQAGTMPPADYTFFNHDARLNDAEREALIRWASAAQR